MPPARKPRVGNTMLQSIDKHVSAVLDREEDKAIEDVRLYLLENKEGAKRCLVALQSGYFKTDRDFTKKKDCIPESRTSIDILSYKFLSKVLHTFCPRFSERDLTSIGKKNKLNIYRLFTFGLAIADKEPVWSHSVPKFTASCKARYEQLGKRLEGLTISEEFDVLWQERGAFRLAEEEGGEIYIEHVSGVKVKAPDGVTSTDDEHTYFIENWSETIAKLATDEMEMKILPRFQKAGHSLSFTVDWNLSCESAGEAMSQESAPAGSPNRKREAKLPDSSKSPSKVPAGSGANAQGSKKAKLLTAGAAPATPPPTTAADAS